jgi:hypothetical protein
VGGWSQLFCPAAKDVKKEQAKVESDADKKAKADKEKKEADAREIEKKRVAHSPMEGRGPAY